MENILVTPSGHVCIADFGNARVLDRELNYQEFHAYHLYGASGTEGYLPPERVERHKGYNFKTDTWTYAVILLELLLINGGVSNALYSIHVEAYQSESTGTQYITMMMERPSLGTTARYPQVTMRITDWHL